MAKDFNIVLPIQGYTIQRGMDPHTKTEGEYLVLTGWASDTSIDKLNGEMSADCIVGMVNCVNTRVYRNVQEAKAAPPVGVDVEHSNDWNKQLGWVQSARALYDVPAEMVARGVKPPVMEVELWCDMEMSATKDLKRSLDKGTQLGLSIFGKVKRGFREVNRSINKVVEKFQEVDLLKIAITGKPVNNNTWLAEVKRSLDGDELEIVEVAEAPQETAPANEGSPEVSRAVPDPTPEPEPVATEAALSPEAEADILGGDVARGNATPSADSAAPDLESAILADLTPAAEPDPAPPPAPEPVQETPAVEAQATPAEVPAPAVTPAPATEPSDTAASGGETVARAEGYVSRAELDSHLSQVRDLLGPLPDFIERAQAAIHDLSVALAERDATIMTLTERLEKVEAMGMGRRGTVARSMPEEEPEREAPRVLGEDLDPATRNALVRQLALAGRPEAAVAFAMGWLKDEPVHINDPLLPQG
jgi:hypothetical protein